MKNLMNANKVINLGKIIEAQRQFVRERDWEQFHTPKNLAMALAGESGELLELFQWLSPEQSKHVADDPKRAEMLRHEMADIFFYLARLADHFEIDLEAAVWEKMERNAQRYPAELSRGKATKYTEL